VVLIQNIHRLEIRLEKHSIRRNVLSSFRVKNDRWQTEKNGFVTATKLGTKNNFLVAATKNFAAATKRFVDKTKHFVVVTKYFCYLTNAFVGITKPFIPSKLF